MAKKGTPHKVGLQQWANKLVDAEKLEWGKWQVKFAFKYFHSEHGILCGKGMDSDRTRAMFVRFKEYEKKTWGQMYAEKANTHFHPIDFTLAQRQEYRSGFKTQLTADMADLIPYQVAMSKQIRFFGVLYIGSFYVVWCDANHHVFPSE